MHYRKQREKLITGLSRGQEWEYGEVNGDDVIDMGRLN